MREKCSEICNQVKSLIVEKYPEILVVLVCVLLFGVGVSQKEGYHMDELLSFELSNAQFNPWIVSTQPQGRLAKFVENEIQGENFIETLGNLTDTIADVIINRGNSKILSYQADVYEEPVWIEKEQFQDYITVDNADDFNYLSVYFNVKDDNHPPLHFMILHTISSLFKGHALPFMGCIINIAAVAATMVILMKAGRKLALAFGMEIRERETGILAALFYGLSVGAMSTVLLIRMYALLTFFCMALFYIHLKKWLEGDFEKGNKLLIAVTVLGFLTQYFFLFYCLLLAVVTVVLLWTKRRQKELFCYLRSMVMAAVIGIVCFPFSIADVFSSGRGTEALKNLSEGFLGYGSRLLAFGKIIIEKTPFLLFVLVAVFLIGVMILLTKKRGARGIRLYYQPLKRRNKNAVLQRTLLWLLILPVAGYFLLAARMSPYLVDRYIMPVFPFIALIGTLFLVEIICQIEVKTDEKHMFAFVSIGIILILLWNLVSYNGSYLYKGYAAQEQTAQENSEYPCICVYDGVGYYENLKEFTYYEKTLLVTMEELSNRQDVKSISALDKAVVIGKQNVDWNQVAEVMQTKYGLVCGQQLVTESVYGDNVYLFVRENGRLQ